MEIYLRPFEISDVEYLSAWIKTEAELVQWSGAFFCFPLQKDQLITYQASSNQKPPIRKIYKAVPDSDERISAGHIELNDLDFRNRSASISRVLVNPELRNQGVCQQMVNQILAIAFNQFMLHRISLRVYDFNLPAIHSYEKAGFRREGFFRHYSLVNNQWWDSWSMAILEDEWRAPISPSGGV